MEVGEGKGRQGPLRERRGRGGREKGDRGVGEGKGELGERQGVG